MAKNFKQAFNELSTKLSLKDKQQKIGAQTQQHHPLSQRQNYTKIEKPLSRNVRFLDLSSSQAGKNGNQSIVKQQEDTSSYTTNINNQNLTTNNQSKSQLSFALNSNGQVQHSRQYGGSQTVFNQIKQQPNFLLSSSSLGLNSNTGNGANNKRSALNNQLKRSIDLTLGLQQPIKKPQAPQTTKHQQSSSMSFQVIEGVSNTQNNKTIAAQNTADPPKSRKIAKPYQSLVHGN